jgi:hypothetical protein
MHKFIKKAVSNIDQQIIENILPEEEAFIPLEENYEEAYRKVRNSLEDFIPGDISIYLVDYDEMEYLCDSISIEDFVRQILDDLCVPEEEISNYLCETLFTDSFLEAEEDGDFVVITVNTFKLQEYLVDNEINY